MRKFLKLHKACDKFHSHVAMGELKGSFYIARNEWETFWETYGNGSHPSTLGLAEKQKDYSPFLVDIDLSKHIDEQYTQLYNENDVKKLIQIYQQTIHEKVDGITEEMLTCLYLSKNAYQDGNKLKHGLHLHFPFIWMSIDSLTQVTNHVSNLMQETNIFENFTDKTKLIDSRVHKVPWLIYGSSKGKEKEPYLFNKAFTFKLKNITLEKALESYTLYDSREKQINIKNKVEEYLPRILSVIHNKQPIYELKKNAFPKPIHPKFEIRQDEERIEFQDLNPDSKETEDMIRQIMSLVGDYHAEDRMDWLKCGWILNDVFKGNEIGLQIWQEFSSKCEEKYDETNCACIWEKMMVDGTVGIGTLKYWAKIDSPELYSSTITKLPQELTYKECEVIEINGFESVSYINLLNKYDTLFIKGNMGCGKTEKIRSVIPLYNKIVFVSSKRSLAYDFNKKYPEFELYEKLNGTIDVDVYNKVIIQVDSLNRLIGQVDLFIIDEFIDLSSQLLSSKNRTESIDSFKVHLKHSNKRIIMDANLNRIDYFESIVNFEKSIFVKDNKVYHTNKEIKIFNDPEQLTIEILNISIGKMFVPSDSKQFIDVTAKQYTNKYPKRKVLVLTSDSSCEAKKSDWDDYDVIFCSPTITAGVSYKTKIDHVYGYYTKESINTWSSTQQLLRCRNWDVANIYISQRRESSILPFNDGELEIYIENRFTIEIGEFGGCKINRIKKTIDKNFTYYMYLEDIKRTNLSKKFFKYYFLKIMKEHGIKSSIFRKCVETEELVVMKEQKKKISNEITEELINQITKAEPTEEDMINFKAGKFDHINKAVIQAILMFETYGFCPTTVEGVRTYINKRKVFKNICKTIQEIDKPEELKADNYSKLDIKDQNDIQRRSICNMILKSAGFTGLLDQSCVPTVNEKVENFIHENLEKIQTIFNSNKTVTLKSSKNLMHFVNSKLEDVYGIRLVGKEKQKNKIRFYEYKIEGMEIWSENPNQGKPCITNKFKPLLSL